jgi:hypothetical protein
VSPLSRDPHKRARQLANLRNAPAAPRANTRALRHGAYAQISKQALDEKTREIFEAFAEDVPLRDPDGGLPSADALPVRLLAEALVRLDSVSEYLRRRGWETDDGQPRPAVEIEQRLRREAFEYGEALGLSPRSRAKLGLDLQRGFDLASAMSEPSPGERDRKLGAMGLISEEADDAD